MRHFDMATWLARRRLQAPADGLPEPAMVALPGARAAIEIETLHAHQQLGRREVDIVGRINQRYLAEHAEEIDSTAKWAAGPYRELIVKLEQDRQQAQAAEMRAQAALQRLAESDG